MESTRTAPFKLKATWWLGNRNYLIFMLRELSPVFIALCFIRILKILAQVPAGAGVTGQVLSLVPGGALAVLPDWASLATAPAVAFAVISLAFALLHSVTFFQAGAVIMPLKVAGKPVPGILMVLGNLGAMAGFAVLLAVAVVKL